MHEVVITGIGLVSSLGEDIEGHRLLLTANVAPVFNHVLTPPYPIHPLVSVDYDQLIPKKSDQRQMDPGQRLGVFAAGLALRDAGILGDVSLLTKTHVIVAAGGGERDIAVDEAIMSGLRTAADAGSYLNERLSRDLRPTLFLAQLPNLLAGNISIVHGVAGSSRTFMGEEAAGMDAIAAMAARIRAGTAEIGLAGGAYAAARPDMQLLLGFAGTLLAGEPAGVWERSARNGGMICGSVGAFLLMESRAHAEARGARIAAVVGPSASGYCFREGDALTQSAGAAWRSIESALEDGPLGILSGATGVEPATAQELALLYSVCKDRETYIRATGTMLGHSLEAAMPANVALAALALREKQFFLPFESSSIEQPAAEPPSQILVTSFGHWRGEGMLLLRRDSGAVS